MSIDLSIILPSIRYHSLLDLLDSIPSAIGDFEYEVVIASPIDEILALDINPLIKTIKSFASPNVALQQCVLAATKKYIFWTSDDGVLIPNTLYENLNFILNNSTSYRDVYGAKYTESDNPSPDMYGNQYYKINNHVGTRCVYIPDSYQLMNNAYINRNYLLELGGFDCQFQTMIMGLIDIAVRVQRNGYPFTLLDTVVSHHKHGQNDHTPIEIAQSNEDEPLFRSIYNSPESVNRINIELDNWKKQPEIWRKRFSD